MNSKFYNEGLDDFLFDVGVELAVADDGCLYLFAFNDESMKTLRWLVFFLKGGFLHGVSPIAFSDRVSISRGDDALIMSAVYTEKLFDTFVDLLPEIKKLYYECKENGFFG